MAVDSINSAYDDKCPFVGGRHMVFASESRAVWADLIFATLFSATANGVHRSTWGRK
ncbi:MAG: hypothetical protein MZV63_11175 [Marinilabiliales bacterium]|nr:hypothetical protein [Marinilabiliales bacterium]